MKNKTKINRLTLAFASFMLVAVILCGCEQRGNKQREVNIDIGEYDIAIIDSCEYIVDCYDRSRSITHKGNCKYCAVRGKK